MRTRWLGLVILAAGLWTSASSAQLRVRPIADETGEIAWQLMLRKLRVTGTFMAATAHPDDENSSLLAKMGWGLGLRTVLVTATRGDGGQNEIGPEIFDALAVLRTEELMAVHRFDGAEQLFTRAVDFGYSFSIDETYEKWGRNEIIGDFVRHIRTVRPDAIVGFLWDGTGGGLHHQASTRIVAEAFRAAADPSRYPEQIREGLRPWQAMKLYSTELPSGTPPPGSLAFDATEYDALLGKTYSEIGLEARSMHKCQGTTQLLNATNPAAARAYKLRDTVLPGGVDVKETSMLDGVDVGLVGLARFAGASARSDVAAKLRSILDAVDTAAAAGVGVAGAAAIADGLTRVRSLRADIGRMSIAESERWELDFRLSQKERQFQDALLLAASVEVDATSDDAIVAHGVGGFQITPAIRNRGRVEVSSWRADMQGVDGVAMPCGLARVEARGTSQCTWVKGVSPQMGYDSPIVMRHHPTAARYEFDSRMPFGAPFEPTPFRVKFTVTIAGAQVEVERPIEARDGTDWAAGEKRSEILVVPALTVTASPEVMVMPTGARAPREMRVTVRNNAKTPSTATVRLHLPVGWTAAPPSVPVSLAREDEAVTVRFQVTAPAGATPGAAMITADAVSDGQTFTSGYQVIDYPHIRRRLLFRPAEVQVTLVDVRVAPGLKIGYVMGVGDKVPDAIAQLGVPVSLIGADELAWGDLSKYTAIMTGVRAYERRADLRANNASLIEYARNGGVVLVNYNKTEFNQAQYGPYPAQVSSNRVTDERAPIRVLVPNHPVFTTPNAIGPASWADWVQERGTYFLGQRAPEYVDLIESEDPFPNNAGPKRGALVEARIGKGRWVYVGLVLWRELPAGVPGAYQLLANLISLRPS